MLHTPLPNFTNVEETHRLGVASLFPMMVTAGLVYFLFYRLALDAKPNRVMLGQTILIKEDG